MKKLLLLALAASAVVFASWGVIDAMSNHYLAHQNKKQHAQASAVELATKAQYNADQVKIHLLTSLNSQLLKMNRQMKAECEKGLAAYALLTPYTKTKTFAPVCTAHKAQ